MKQIFYPLLFLVVFSSCASNKNFLSRRDEEKALQDAIKALNKKRGNKDAEEAIPALYNSIREKHLASIRNYSQRDNLDRFDRMASAYNSLQNAYWAIIESDAARELVKPVDYSPQLSALKQEAAEAYYQQGDDFLKREGRDNAKQAYRHFKTADEWVANYRDSKSKMNEAFDAAVVNVMINPVSFTGFYGSGWNFNNNNNFNLQNFQQNLVRDLGGSYGSRYPARFFTDWQARSGNEEMDWVIDLNMRDLQIPNRPYEQRSSRRASRQVEVGRDTANRPIYNTVYATVNIVRSSITATARMEVNIQDLETRRNISNNTVSEDYTWRGEYADFTGDQRALSDEDWRMVNNRQYIPNRDEILSELYSRLYPRVRNEITWRVDW